MSLVIRAVLDSCRTTTDGGWKIAFACGQDQVEQISQLSLMREENLFVVVMTESEYQSGQKKPAKKKSEFWNG